MRKTEQRNPKTTHFSEMSSLEMVKIINEENMNSVRAVEAALEDVARAIDAVSEAFLKGGRLIYVGAGTSARIAVMDAAECPPTYGVDYNTVITVMAGGRDAMFRAAENEEDSAEKGRADLLAKDIKACDVVMGISASGGAEYVASAMRAAKEIGCTTISLASNYDTKIGALADVEIVCDTGAEVITGSTRMKAGNSQKFVLNMITTCAMSKTGKVYENLMINLRPTNIKLRHRMIGIVSDICEVDEARAEELLEENEFSIRKVFEKFGKV